MPRTAEGGARLWLSKGRQLRALRPARRGGRAARAAPIYCGAKVGDHFELRGEMLHLPPGQGISIYSLASVLPLLAAKQRPTDTQRLDDDRRRDRLPRPELLDAAAASRAPACAASAMRRPRRCRSMTEVRHAAHRASRPDYEISRVIRGGWQMAGGHGAVRATTRSPTWSPSPTPASPPSTAPTSTPASRS